MTYLKAHFVELVSLANKKRFAFIPTIFLGALGFADRFLPKDLLNQISDSQFNFILSALFTAAVLVIVQLVFPQFFFRYLKLVESPIEVFIKELPDSECIRIFASNGDCAKQIFIDLSRRNNAVQRPGLKVKILLRTIPGDEARKRLLQQKIEAWKKYVSISTTFAYFESPVMLNGFIFDDRFAMLAWYSRPSGTGMYKSPANLPYIPLSEKDQCQRKLIKEAISTFDSHFNSGELSND